MILPQDLVPKERLVKALHMEFVTVVNEVGVDPNRLLEHPHTVALMQFVCGLGPRKGSQLLKVRCVVNTEILLTLAVTLSIVLVHWEKLGVNQGVMREWSLIKQNKNCSCVCLLENY